MDRQLKQRVVGAAVLVVLGVIFIPIFLDQGTLDTHVPDAVDIPPPASPFEPRVAPLEESEVEALERRAAQPVEIPQPEPREASNADATASDDAAEPGAGAPAEQEAAAPASASRESEAAEPAAVAREQPSTDGAAWTVQLGSFTHEDNATRLIEKLRAAGFAAYVERGESEQGTVHKVRVGPEDERAAAEQLRERLHERFGLEGLLLRYP